MQMQAAKYRSQILAAYEGEVAGAAYFDALRSSFPDKSAFLERCAALERATASQLSVLVRKYQLTPRSQRSLAERGVLDARTEPGSDWRELMQKSIASYAKFVTEFKALESLGPAADQPVLTALTAHEIRLIEWMRAEAE